MWIDTNLKGYCYSQYIADSHTLVPFTIATGIATHILGLQNQALTNGIDIGLYVLYMYTHVAHHKLIALCPCTGYRSLIILCVCE